MKFEKWQALGNDYVIIEESETPFEWTAARVEGLCALHTGVGSDGLLLICAPTREETIARVRIFNPDGSEAELSGNGVREAVLYLRRSGWTGEDTFTVETVAGLVTPTLTGPGSASVDMGTATTQSAGFPSGGKDGRGTVVSAGREWAFQHVSIGNPQCAIEVADGLEDLDLAQIGPPIESSDLFPNRTNVSFYSVSGDRIRTRIFERGVGETLSSGTGASGAAIAAHLAGAPSQLTVELDGGDLGVEIGPGLEVRLTGTAEPVYRGELSAELTERLGRLGG